MYACVHPKAPEWLGSASELSAPTFSVEAMLALHVRNVGGFAGWLRAAAIAGAAGVPMSSHLYPEISAHLLRVTETAHWLEWQDWVDPLLQQPFALRSGALHVTDAPGVGIEWNEDAVAAHLAA